MAVVADVSLKLGATIQGCGTGRVKQPIEENKNLNSYKGKDQNILE